MFMGYFAAEVAARLWGRIARRFCLLNRLNGQLAAVLWIMIICRVSPLLSTVTFV